MNHFQHKKKYKINEFIIKSLIDDFWFIPSDVMQRGLEANIWRLCSFKSPTLSIGIGNGEIDSILFKKQLPLDVGIDIESSQFERVKELNIYKKVEMVNAEKMPFESKSFNTVISNSSFEHIRNDSQAINEAGRVLKKNGYLFITVPSIFFKKWILDSKGLNNKKKLEKFNKRAEHYHYRSKQDWEKILHASGLEIQFHAYFMPKRLFYIWFLLFRLFTVKILHKELWSIVGHSRITSFLPISQIKKVIHISLKRTSYLSNSFIDAEIEGAQQLIIAKKV